MIIHSHRSKGALGTCAPSRSNFFHFFMQFSAKILQNNRFVVQVEGFAAPPSGKYWIRNCTQWNRDGKGTWNEWVRPIRMLHFYVPHNSGPAPGPVPLPVPLSVNTPRVVKTDGKNSKLKSNAFWTNSLFFIAFFSKLSHMQKIGPLLTNSSGFH